jgi:MFS transporter, NNP family, nitrate/nitrite transporter
VRPTSRASPLLTPCAALLRPSLQSKVFKFWSFNKPHHRSFQMNWVSFFLAFFATFAAAPLIPIIRDDLDLTKPDLGNGALASVTGAIFSRVVIGVFCDSYGPRYGHALLHLVSSTATFSMATGENVGLPAPAVPPALLLPPHPLAARVPA